MAHNGPTPQDLLLALGLTAEMFRPADRPVVHPLNLAEQQQKKEMKFHYEAQKAQQEQHYKSQRKVKMQKPVHYGKSSTPIGKPGQ